MKENNGRKWLIGIIIILIIFVIAIGGYIIYKQINNDESKNTEEGNINFEYMSPDTSSIVYFSNCSAEEKK
jgi:uncharacterized protein YpmB